MSELRDLLIETGRRHSLGGAAIAVTRKGQAPRFECIGLADRRAHRPVEPATVFRIASISKTMTAIGLLQLRDEGRLALDDPVNKYLSAFTVEPPAGGDDVTFRHLLTHTSGIGEVPRVSDLPRRHAWGMSPPGAAPADLGALYSGVLHTDVPAGSKWAYANHAFAVLAQVVEELSGRPFGEHMHDALFAPLGMSSTEYSRTDRTAPHLATGSHWLAGRLRDMKDYDLAIMGPGSVLSSVADMAVYAEWLLHAGDGVQGAVLDPGTLAEMMSPQYNIDPRLPGMGLAFFLDHIGTHRVAGHDGGVPGFSSSLLVAPDDGVGVVVVTNTSTMFGAHALATEALRSLLDVPHEDIHVPAPGLALNPHTWHELVGHYAPDPGFLTNARSWQMFGGEVQVVVKDKRLHLRALSPVPALRHGLELHPAHESDPLRLSAELDGVVLPVAFRRSTGTTVDTLLVGAPANAILHRRSSLRSSQVRRRVVAAVAAAATLRALRRRRHRRAR